MYERFESLLKRDNVKVSDVCKATGIRNSTMTDWKKGRTTPKADKLKLIADFFHVPVDYFYSGATGDGHYLDEETIEIAQALFENKELRLLFDEAKDADSSYIQAAHSILIALKKKERKADD